MRGVGYYTKSGMEMSKKGISKTTGVLSIATQKAYVNGFGIGSAKRYLSMTKATAAKRYAKAAINIQVSIS